MMNGRFENKSGRVALGGILSAAGVALLWVACTMPSGRLGVTAAAGLFPMIGVLAAGRTVGYFCWAVTAVLGLFLVPDKMTVLLFAVFLGIYPVVKSRIESLRRMWLEWIIKLLYFNGVLVVAVFVLKELFLPMLPGMLSGQNGLIFLAGNVVFCVYDVGLTRLISMLVVRFHPRRHG